MPMIQNAIRHCLKGTPPDTSGGFFHDFLCFGIKQAYACIFGGALLAGILTTRYLWPQDAPLARYDFLFIYAILIQVALLFFRLESWREARIIVVFHVIGTAMEIFKTHVGSWSYPEDNLIRVGGVPLFSGFMYSAVGSYMARVWRIFQFRFTHFPATHLQVILCVLIYANFFTHHYLPDIRYGLFAFCIAIFLRTFICFTPAGREYRMPLLLGFFLVSIFIWIAENADTLGAIWVYPSQRTEWHIVPLAKLGSWYLLMIISFVLVGLLHDNKHQKIRRELP